MFWRSAATSALPKNIRCRPGKRTVFGPSNDSVCAIDPGGIAAAQPPANIFDPYQGRDLIGDAREWFTSLVEAMLSGELR